MQYRNTPWASLWSVPKVLSENLNLFKGGASMDCEGKKKKKRKKKIKRSHCNFLDLLKCGNCVYECVSVHMYLSVLFLQICCVGVWSEEMDSLFSLVLSSVWVFLLVDFKGTVWNRKAKYSYFEFIIWMHLHDHTKVFILNCIMKPTSHYTNHHVYWYLRRRH